jgi:hypothetical protein
MADLVNRKHGGKRQTFERMRDLLHEIMDDTDVRAGMSVDIARRVEEVLADADATELADLEAPPPQHGA